MLGDLFDSPWKILIIAVVILVLFGSRKLPHAARSLGQSMRILKKEVQGLHEEDQEATAQSGTSAPQFQQPQLTPAPAAAPADQQQQIRDLQRASTMDSPVPSTPEPQHTQPS